MAAVLEETSGALHSSMNQLYLTLIFTQMAVYLTTLIRNQPSPAI